MAGSRGCVDGGVTVTRVEDFLTDPPPGFSVEPLGSGAHGVHSDPDESLVLVDAAADDDTCVGGIVFHNSVGRTVTARDLWEYTSFRKSLLSKRIYLLVSVCEEVTRTREATVLQRYVVCVDARNPAIKWQMEKGLDWAISSVTGESYRVDIDLIELLESWAQKNTQIISEKPIQGKPVWRDTFFTLKYNSDALFDFPHWFGFSKRRFKLRPT